MLPGLTHAIIYFNTVDGAKESGTSAVVKLCFGSDEDAVSQIAFNSKDAGWKLPTINRKGIDYDIFFGKTANELLLAAGRASDRVRAAKLGKLADRKFRVTKTTIEEIKDQAT